MPDSSQFKTVVKVIELQKKNLLLLADVVAQQLVCFWDEESAPINGRSAAT